MAWSTLLSHYKGKDTDKRFKISPDDPGKAAWRIASHCTPGYVEELIAFLQEYLEMAREDSANILQTNSP